MNDVQIITAKRYIHLSNGQILIGDVVTSQFVEGRRISLPDDYVIVKNALLHKDNYDIVPYVLNENVTEIPIFKYNIITSYPAE